MAVRALTETNVMRRTMSNGLLELLQRIKDATEATGHPPRTNDIMKR
jgi:hypothetical protein